MASRVEVTARCAGVYATVSKKDRGRILDEVVSVTGWSGDNARCRLAAAAKAKPGSGRSVAGRASGVRRSTLKDYLTIIQKSKG